MKTLVFLLEERSAEELLKVILPRILPHGIEQVFITFEGKQDLERNVERKIRGWRLPESYFIVMRDQDSGDCYSVKSHISEMCINAGRSDCLVRIACHELENFYLGDLEAVAKAYSISPVSQNKKKFRKPDELTNAAEEMRKLTDMKYQKIDGARRIAQFLRLDGSNVSTSFNMLIDGIRRISAQR